MKRYRILVTFETQRTKDYQIHGVWAGSQEDAEYIAIGLIMQKERETKNRYLRITGTCWISDEATQEQIAEQIAFFFNNKVH